MPKENEKNGTIPTDIAAHFCAIADDNDSKLNKSLLSVNKLFPCKIFVFLFSVMSLTALVSAIWLVILGEWHVIIEGILFILISVPILSVFMMPNVFLTSLIAKVMNQGKKIPVLLLQIIVDLYLFSLISVWCLGIMWHFVYVYENPIIPLFFWSYGIALSPWWWFCKKDERYDNTDIFATLPTFFAQLAYLGAIAMFFMGIQWKGIIMTFLVIMFIGVILFQYLQYQYYVDVKQQSLNKN